MRKSLVIIVAVAASIGGAAGITQAVASLGSSEITVRTATSGAVAGPTGGQSVNCASNERAVGGGGAASLGQVGVGRMINSYPINGGTGWSVAFNDLPYGSTVKTSAICVAVGALVADKPDTSTDLKLIRTR